MISFIAGVGSWVLPKTSSRRKSAGRRRRDRTSGTTMTKYLVIDRWRPRLSRTRAVPSSYTFIRRGAWMSTSWIPACSNQRTASIVLPPGEYSGLNSSKNSVIRTRIQKSTQDYKSIDASVDTKNVHQIRRYSFRLAGLLLIPVFCCLRRRRFCDRVTPPKSNRFLFWPCLTHPQNFIKIRHIFE